PRGDAEGQGLDGNGLAAEPEPGNEEGSAGAKVQGAAHPRDRGKWVEDAVDSDDGERRPLFRFGAGDEFTSPGEQAFERVTRTRLGGQLRESPRGPSSPRAVADDLGVVDHV